MMRRELVFPVFKNSTRSAAFLSAVFTFFHESGIPESIKHK